MTRITKPITFVGPPRPGIEEAVRFAEDAAAKYLKELGPNAPLILFSVQTVGHSTGWCHLITYHVPSDY